MAYTMKDVFYLDTTLSTGSGTGEGIAVLDLSSYVDPIARGKAKGQGLAIYKVQWDIADGASNDPVAAGSAGTFRAGLIAFTGLPAAAVGSADFADSTLAGNNDLMISGIDFWGGATAAGDPHPNVWLEPSPDVPYVVVRDQVCLIASVPIAMSNAADINVRMECAIVTLDQSTLNQLLRTQTV